MSQEPQMSESTRRLLAELYSPIGPHRLGETMRPFARAAAESRRALEHLSVALRMTEREEQS